MMTRKEIIEQVFLWNNTDKLGHGYAMIYSHVPSTIKNVFEIGVADGASIRSWLELFPEANVWGLDMEDRPVDHPRVTIIKSDINDYQVDAKLPKFDLIVDDGSHQHPDILAGWRKLNEFCRGMYVIEDVDYGVVKEVIDELRGRSNVTSVIQTAVDNGSRAIVASFDKVIQW